jgi:hypothetical protein
MEKKKFFYKAIPYVGPGPVKFKTVGKRIKP